MKKVLFTLFAMNLLTSTNAQNSVSVAPEVSYFISNTFSIVNNSQFDDAKIKSSQFKEDIFKKDIQLGYGVSASCDLDFNDHMSFIARIGLYRNNLQGANGYINSVPLNFGVKYYISKHKEGFYPALSLGMQRFSTNFISITDTIGNIFSDLSASSTNFSIVPSLGFKKNGFDLRASYSMTPTATEIISYTTLSLSIELFNDKKEAVVDKHLVLPVVVPVPAGTAVPTETPLNPDGTPTPATTNPDGTAPPVDESEINWE